MRPPETHAATPLYAEGEHVLVLLDFLVYRAEIVAVLPDYAPRVNAYVVTIHNAPAYLKSPEQFVIVEGATSGQAIVGRPSADLDW